MQLYFYVLIIVWVAAFIEFFHRKTWVLIPSMIVSFLFTSLRYETGNDWTTYEMIFNSVKPFFSSSLEDIINVSTIYNKEIIYILYNSILKQINGDFQIIIFTSSLIYFVSFYLFINEKTYHRATTFAVSYSWLVFSLYFSTISQSLAVSCFLLFWLCIEQRKILFSVIFFVLSPLFQLSSLMYFVFYFLSKKMVPKRILYFFWSICIVNLFLAIFFKYDAAFFLLKYLLILSSKLPTGVLYNKIYWYLYGRGLIPSMYDLLLVVVFTIPIGGWLLLHYDVYKKMLGKNMYTFSMYFIFFQSLFVNHVVFRYRFFYAAFPVLCIVLFQYYGRKPYSIRFAVLALACTVSVSYEILYLNSPSSITFVPYQNYVYYKLASPTRSSDGHERTKERYRNLQRFHR